MTMKFRRVASLADILSNNTYGNKTTISLIQPTCLLFYSVVQSEMVLSRCLSRTLNSETDDPLSGEA